jgi:hypothetical protein
MTGYADHLEGTVVTGDGSFLLVQQFLESDERLIGCGLACFIRMLFIFFLLFKEIALMLSIVTIDAKQLPIASVRRIVVVVVILVVDGQLLKLLTRELPSASGANVGIHFERSIPILVGSLFLIPQSLCDDLRRSFSFCFGFRPTHARFLEWKMCRASTLSAILENFQSDITSEVIIHPRTEAHPKTIAWLFGRKIEPPRLQDTKNTD